MSIERKKEDFIEDMCKKFKEQFTDNTVWWQECLAEMQIGDPDFKRLDSFIRTALTAAIEEGRRQALEELRESLDNKD